MLKTHKFPSPNSDLSFESQTGISNSLRDMPSGCCKSISNSLCPKLNSWVPLPISGNGIISNSDQDLRSPLGFLSPSYSPPFPQHPQPFTKFLPIFISKIPLSLISTATTSVLATTIHLRFCLPWNPLKVKSEHLTSRETAETATNSSSILAGTALHKPLLILPPRGRIQPPPVKP